MNKDELLNCLESAFANIAYPKNRDFYKAIAEKEYEDYIDPGENKRWEDLSKDELQKHYDFIYYLDSDAKVYYLPSYIKLILENSKCKEDEHFIDLCTSCLFTLLSEIDIKTLNARQLQIINHFLNYCREIIYPIFDLNITHLKKIQKHLEGN